MKSNKTLTLFGIIVISLLSIFNSGCDKSDTPTTVTCYLSKMLILNDGIATQTIEFEYKNNVIKRVTDDNIYNEYIYLDEGNLSSIVHYEDGKKESESRYSYEQNIVTINYGHFVTNGDWVSDDWKQVYEFDKNDQLIRNEKHIKPDSVWEMQSYDLYEWSNQNISMKEHWVRKDTTTVISPSQLESITNLKISDDDFEKYSVSTYQYDNTFHPSTASKVLMFGEVTKNNVIKEELTLVSTNETSILTYSYEYNDQNYPTSRLTTTSSGETFHTKYEYNCY